MARCRLRFPLDPEGHLGDRAGEPEQADLARRLSALNSLQGRVSAIVDHGPWHRILAYRSSTVSSSGGRFNGTLVQVRSNSGGSVDRVALKRSFRSREALGLPRRLAVAGQLR